MAMMTATAMALTTSDDQIMIVCVHKYLSNKPNTHNVTVLPLQQCNDVSLMTYLGTMTKGCNTINQVLYVVRVDFSVKHLLKSVKRNKYYTKRN